jgi:hypothetical protein
MPDTPEKPERNVPRLIAQLRDYFSPRIIGEVDDVYVKNEGDFYIVKKGTQHRVSSVEECAMVLVEGKSAKHTGNVQSKITKSIEEQR